MERALRKILLNGLKPSKIADHKYHLESQEERCVRREAAQISTGSLVKLGQERLRLPIVFLVASSSLAIPTTPLFWEEISSARGEAFPDQLSGADFDTVNQNVRAQLKDLLIAPWQVSKPACPKRPPFSEGGRTLGNVVGNESALIRQ
ncbi:hypothetical protein CVT25_006876 [Psilocybe cyanescens]|uniref:Uncharacterized protein n=1 Tax=Psilocybe cyanescens TaxID=93625 RepID=A0A409XH35_PSICY|nr:hypothetical protein CVT25_006876 [Psilocybe cyanescens]